LYANQAEFLSPASTFYNLLCVDRDLMNHQRQLFPYPHMNFLATGAATFLFCLGLVSAQTAVALRDEPGCGTLRAASTGGPMPTNPNVLVLRYLGRANYEIAYRGRVLLLDTYYDDLRLPFGERFGIKESDITRADSILVGHTHFDHFGDAPAIAKRTGASILAGPIAARYVASEGVPERQIHLVRGGETMKFDGYTVQTALGIHMPIDPSDDGGFHEMITTVNPLTDAEKTLAAEWRKGQSDGTRLALAEDAQDPENDTVHHGTIVYVLTFDGGYRLLYSDTSGVLSGGERTLADSIHTQGGKINLAILGYLQLGFSIPKAIKVTETRVKTWSPTIFLPSHFHDGEKAELPDMPTAPLFEALRNSAPGTRSIEPIYRSPICVNTKTDEFFVGYYVH
jgi:L-ascorbate metabolism protein UlaG (beta-lactamase superfamily)